MAQDRLELFRSVSDPPRGWKRLKNDPRPVCNGFRTASRRLFRVRTVIPQIQSKVGQQQGRCFEACISSLLEIPEYTVPEFPREDEPFMLAVQSFLREYGLFYLQVAIDDAVAVAAFQTGDVWHVIEGVSDRGGPHAVVGLNGRLVHDPHPGGKGLVSEECYGFLVSRAQCGPRLE